VGCTLLNKVEAFIFHPKKWETLVIFVIKVFLFIEKKSFIKKTLIMKAKNIRFKSENSKKTHSSHHCCLREWTEQWMGAELF
jgi:hypothetical protein